MNLIDFLKQTLQRLQAYSPEYFVKLRKIAGWITALALIISYFPDACKWFEINIQFSSTMLAIVAVCAKIWKLFAVVFGFTWLPADFQVQAKFQPGQIVYVKRTGMQTTINSIASFEIETDTKTGRKDRYVRYMCATPGMDMQVFYEIELTDIKPEN